MKKLILIALLLVMSSSFAQADDESVKKYKNFTPQQIKELPDKIRESSVPMMYTMAAQAGLAPDAELAFSSWLNTLMYPGVHDYAAAVKAFQADMGDEPTGILTVWQIYNLQQRAEMQTLGSVGFPDMFSSYITGDSASVEGTAVIIDEKIAWPINHVKVHCYKADQYCEYDQIVLTLPDKNSWAQSYSVMDMGTTIYKITRWENDEIDAVPSNGDTACRSTSLNYNFKTKEFFEITRNKEGDCKILDQTFERLSKPRMAQIVDGKEVIQKEFSNIKKKSYDVLSSDFRKKVDKLIAENSKNEKN